MNVHFSNNALTNNGFSSPGSPRTATGRERGKLTLPWSLLLLGSGYFLLVAGPLWSSRASVSTSVHALLSGAAWLPAPAAAGLALLGAAALIFVVARLVRDVEQRPYASIAPVLAVFSGFVLSSVRVDLALPAVTAQQLALLVLALALLGGALVQRDGFSERALGFMLAVLPSFALMLALTAVHGARDPIALLSQVDASLRTYLLLLAVSALSLSAVGAVARRLTRRIEQADSLDAYGEPILHLPRVQQPVAQAMVPPTYVERAVPPPLRRLSAASVTLRGQPMPGAQQSAARSLAGPTSYGRLRATPSTGELSLDDPDLLLLTRGKRTLSRGADGVLLVACAGLVGTYVFVLRPMSSVRDVSSPLSRFDRVRTEHAATTAASSAEDRTAHGAGRAEPRTGPTAPSVESLAPTQQAEPAAPKLAPVTTSLETDLSSDDTPDASSARAHRSHRRRDRASRQRSSASRATDEPSAQKVAPAASVRDGEADEDEERAPGHKKVRAEARPAAASKLSPAAKAAPAPSVPAVAPRTANETELDLDDLVHKALKGGGSSSGADDPLLGL